MPRVQVFETVLFTHACGGLPTSGMGHLRHAWIPLRAGYEHCARNRLGHRAEAILGALGVVQPVAVDRPAAQLDLPVNKLNFATLFDASPNPYLVLGANFVILGANRAYLDVTARTLAEIVDRSIFDAFPASADEAGRDSEQVLRESLDRAVRSKCLDVLPLIRYGLQRETPSGHVFDERFWSATHTPLPGEDGEVAYVVDWSEPLGLDHRAISD